MAPTTLTAGDIAIIGFNFDNPDEFAFVPLVNIGTGTEIKFTDNGWLSSGSFRSNEGTFTWTATQDYTAGSVINPSLSSVAFSASGDQILAYQGEDSNPTFIYALNSEGSTGEWQSDATSSNTSALPTGLINGETAVALPEIDNAIYTGITSGTKAELLSAISNSTNWSGSNSTRQIITNSPFTVTDAGGSTTTQDLFISEYVEGSSNNKAIEIFNGTGAAIDLAAEGYTLEFYFNGNTSPSTTINLSGTITNNDVFVVADNDAAQAILNVADQTSTSNFFNGDDAIVLRKGGASGAILDVIGQIGTDPGSQWGSGLTSTQNNTLRRQSSIVAGDTNPDDAFDPALEWDGFAQDTFDGLGSHTIDGGGNPTPGVTITESGGSTDVNEQSETTDTYTVALNTVPTGNVEIEIVADGETLLSTDGVNFLNSVTLTLNNTTVEGTITVQAVDDSDTEGSPHTGIVTHSIINSADPDYSDTLTPIPDISVNIIDNDVALTPIYDIQGAGHNSSLTGQSVVTNGVVTALASNGFYLQDPTGDGNNATSDGIFVFTSSSPSVSVGESVQVEGTVSEFLPGNASDNLTITQITSPTITTLANSLGSVNATILGTGGRAVPTEVIDNDNFGTFDPAQDGIDFYESVEGMLVQVNDAVAVSTTNRFGEIWVVGDGGANATGINSRGGITISDSDTANPFDDFNPERIQIDDSLFSGSSPTVNVGDELGDVTGVVSYGFGNYEVLPTVAPTVTTGNLTSETTQLVGTSTQLTVASYNVLNLDPNDSDGSTDIANGQFESIASQIVNNLQAPDIIALQEVQDNNGSTNDGTVSASNTYQTLINEISAAGGPQYEFFEIPPENNQDGGQPGGNIRVGYLYKPNRVTIDTNSAVRIGEGNSAFDSSRKSLAVNFTFNGQEVTVINNHFASKGGSDPLFGSVQPPTNAQVEQREGQAQAVNAFVDNLLTQDPNANVVVLGDFNEFQFFSPIEILQGDNLTNLTSTLPEDERYSFIFEGNSQQLDHILISDNLLGNAEYDVVHTNTGFANPASDHDPVLARLLVEPDFYLIEGTRRHDKLIGTDDRDRILGLKGNDAIAGGKGDDIIIGGRGRDLLEGGEGSDKFVYESLRDRSDIITDFEVGKDLIDLSQIFESPKYGSENPFEDYVELITLGSHTVVKVDPNGDRFNTVNQKLVILQGVQGNELSSSDFIVA
ncbi:MAG: endonuclease [Symploca sp. SIO2B6]|nr:endonuclease [Symploca sp. SIO2B6]